MTGILKKVLNLSASLVVACVVFISLSSCVTAMGYAPDEEIPVSLAFKTTSDHFALAVEGVFIASDNLQAPTVAPPQWLDRGRMPYWLGGAQGIDYAKSGETLTFTWDLLVRFRDGNAEVRFPYAKGHIGESRLVVTYPDETGQQVTHTFSASQGPQGAEGVWKIPLKLKKTAAP